VATSILGMKKIIGDDSLRRALSAMVDDNCSGRRRTRSTRHKSGPLSKPK